MYSVRRAALRAASSSNASLAAGVSRQQVASLAMRFSKANARPAIAMPVSRFFSQSARVAQESNEGVEKDAEHAASISSTPPGSAIKTDGFSIFISNMSFDATDMHLREAFGKYGEITAISIGRDGRGLSRGFGFLTFTTKEEADRAVAEANSSFWHGRRINVEHRKQRDATSGPARNREISEPTPSLYIGNIPYETSDADLNRLFRELDNVTDVRVAVDRNTGWPRGFAHADFTDVESAKKAFEKLTTTTLAGRQLRIDYSQKKTDFSKESKNQDPKTEF